MHVGVCDDDRGAQIGSIFRVNQGLSSASHTHQVWCENSRVFFFFFFCSITKADVRENVCQSSVHSLMIMVCVNHNDSGSDAKYGD